MIIALDRRLHKLQILKEIKCLLEFMSDFYFNHYYYNHYFIIIIILNFIVTDIINIKSLVIIIN